MWHFLKLTIPNEKAQGLVEYALILMLVALVVILALTIFGGALGNIYSRISTNLTSL